MIINYDDLGRYEDESFEYEANDVEAEDYILRTHDMDDILMDYLLELYEEEPEDNKEAVKEYGFDGTPESIKRMDDEDKSNLIDDVIGDLIEQGVYDDELKEYFRDEAEDQKADEEDYERNPMAYNGLSYSDF